jgi:hypothetical protein
MRTSTRFAMRDYQGSLDVYIIQESINGDLYVAEPLVLRKVDRCEVLGDPTYRIDSEIGRYFENLFHEAKACGFEPKIADNLSATKYHLEDMRKLVFKENR